MALETPDGWQTLSRFICVAEHFEAQGVLVAQRRTDATNLATNELRTVCTDYFHVLVDHTGRIEKTPYPEETNPMIDGAGDKVSPLYGFPT